MKNLIALFFRLFLRIRYKVELKTNSLNGKFSHTLILPNHPAEIDPVIISAYLWPNTRPKAVVLETVFKMPILKSIFRYLGSIPMPDMEQGSGFYKRKRIRETLQRIVSNLNNGGNVLFYPSGRLSVDGREVLGGASGAYTVIQLMETGSVLLVRSRGLWGSRFSKALTAGARPDIGKSFISGIKTALKNLIFFVPKRPVSLIIEEIPIADLKDKSLAELNSFLEKWYSQDGKEDPSFISDSFLFPDTQPEISVTAQQETPFVLDQDKREKIIEHIAKISQRPVDSISVDMKLGEDLGLDSLTIAELMTWIQDEFECAHFDIADLTNVNSALRAAAHQVTGLKESKVAPCPPQWLASISQRPEPDLPQSSSLAEAFIRSAKRNGSHPACADARLGIRSYKDLLKITLILRESIARLPEKHIGVLLPASSMSAVIIFACLLAKKIPVFLNWTSGTRSLEHSISLLGINSIISAGTVLDSINQDLSTIEDRFLLIEELIASTNNLTKIRSVIESALPTDHIIRHLKLNEISENDTAIILFTSGSEAAPKGVPLLNKNIIENIRSISDVFKFQKNDVVYGFLPPFHSFGLTVTTLMPILCGIRVSFFPNPNESYRIAEGCQTWRVTAMAGTPAFIKGILSAGNVENFSDLRLLMSGADRLSDEIRQLRQDKAPQSLLLEGYGITECSPVVCAQLPNNQTSGVGPPLPRVNLKIVKLDSLTEVNEGEQGLILISGPNVFPGYLGEAKDPFIELNGTKWYNSGDLGFIENGSLVISGRLKRFIKIGGEMISLPAVEEALFSRISAQESELALALVDKEDPETLKPMLTLFSNSKNVSKEQVQQILKEMGFPPLVKLNSVRYLEELPLLGTGKIDIQNLKSQV